MRQRTQIRSFILWQSDASSSSLSKQISVELLQNNFRHMTFFHAIQNEIYYLDPQIGQLQENCYR